MRYVIAGAKSNSMHLYKKYGFTNFLLTQLDRSAIKNILPLLEEGNSLIIDSGAFSVWTRGLELDVDEYGRYAVELEKKYGDKIELYYVGIDSIPGKFGVKPTPQQREESAKKSYENRKYMSEKYKVNRLPVFHQHEDFKRLMKYVNEGADYIGISPANDVKPMGRLKRLQEVYFKYLIPSGKKIKTHGFGITTYSVIKEIPFFSCDSTSRMSGAMYNSYFRFNNGKQSTLTSKQLRKLVGIDYSKLTTLGKYEMNLREISKMVKYVNGLQKARGISYYD